MKAEEPAPTEAKARCRRETRPEGLATDPAADTAPKSVEEPPDPAPNKPIENREWRSVLHSAGQVREAAVTVMVVLTTFCTILSLGALLIFTAGIAPNATARASSATRDHPLRSFFVGAAALLAGALATAATKGILGLLLLPIFTAAVLIGLAGVSEQIGRNLWHLTGKEGHRVGHLTAGWAVFSLVSIFPFIGWFGFFPYYAAVGVGSFFSTLFGGKRPAPVEYRGV